MEAHYYNIEVQWRGEHKGIICTPEIEWVPEKCIEVATPPQFPNGIPGFWSPEHLFTAAASSCLMTTFLSIAEHSKLEFLNFTCTAKGKLEQVDGKLMMTEIHLNPTVTIAHEKDRQKAIRVIEKAEIACLITNSIVSKIIMTPIIKVSN